MFREGGYTPDGDNLVGPSMTSVLDLLERRPVEGGDGPGSGWHAEMTASLGPRSRSGPGRGPPGVRAAVPGPRLGAAVVGRGSVDPVVNERRKDLVRASGFALSLLEGGPLDRRDVMVVALLLRRACDLAGLDFVRLVTAGRRDAGDLGEACLPWLSAVVDTSPATPSTHEEVWRGVHGALPAEAAGHRHRSVWNAGSTGRAEPGPSGPVRSAG